MLGINDPFVAMAYVLCIASACVCVVYAWRNWNRGDDAVQAEDVQWAEQEEKTEETLQG